MKKRIRDLQPLAGGILIMLVILALALLLQMGDTRHSPERAQEYLGEPGAQYWEAPKDFFSKEETAVIAPPAEEGKEEQVPVTRVLFEYIEIVDSCSVHFEGECVNVRSGPGTDFPVVTRLRNHVILKVGSKVEREGHAWFQVVFDETLRYPERVKGDWYVAGEYARVVLDEGEKALESGSAATTTKRIVVNRSEQKLVAYDGDVLFLETPISTGLELTPTPRGTFTVFKKTPSRYMQGPLPDIPASDYYDLPGVPWNLYFTHEGAVIHGAYWHDSFGRKYSHGCVNLPPDTAKVLYDWADVGTTVKVED